MTAPQPARHADGRGFSLVELLLALAITLAIGGSVLLVLTPMAGATQIQPEVADLEQRARVLADTLHRHLSTAGGRAPLLTNTPAAAFVLPGVLPYRIGRRGADPPGTFAADRVTILRVDDRGPQSTLSTPLPAASGVGDVELTGACPVGDLSCGFRAGMAVLVWDESAAWDLYSVTAVVGARLSLQHNTPDSAKVYRAGAAIAAVSLRTFFVRDELTSGTPQLLQYDGAGGADVPVLNHVVRMRVELQGEANPPAIVAGAAGTPAHATYGIVPPAPSQQPTAYPAGENCVFTRSADGEPISRLSAISAPDTLVPLDAAVLTDGPWCPDDAAPGRFDADLLRVRAVRIVARLQAAVAALRGPAGPLFTRGGTARGSRFVPDREVRFTVTVRGMAAGW